MIEIAKISRHSRSRESRDQDRDFDTALEVDGDLDEKKKHPLLKMIEVTTRNLEEFLVCYSLYLPLVRVFLNTEYNICLGGVNCSRGRGGFSASTAAAAAII